MEDERIIELYFERHEAAIIATDDKYGNYLFTVANNILSDEEDSKESVNDTYYAVWNKIPPEKPRVLSAFLARITRNISLKRWRDKRAQKRGGGETEIIFEEIEESVPDGNDFVSQIEAREIGAIITVFLQKIPEKERKIFVCRYWYLDPIADISERFGYKESRIKTMLFRTRKKLLSYLEKEGVLDEYRKIDGRHRIY